MSVLSCNNLSKTFIIDTILDSISFTVEEGDKIGVIGLNGSGKTTLFNILSGNIYPDSGDYFIRKEVKIGYLEQHTKIDSDETVYMECLKVFDYLIKMEKDLRRLEEEISEISVHGESKELEQLMNRYSHLSEKFISLNGYGYESEIRGILKGLGFNEDDVSKEVNLLSGGQKSRLFLAKLLLEKPDLLLLDEPTNHLDIDAINWLEKYLREYKGATLVISHDRYFLDNVVNRIFLLENKKLHIYNSNYTKFMAQRKKDLELQKKQYEDQQKEIKRQEEIIERFMNYGDARYIKQAQSRQKLLNKIKLVDKLESDKRTKIRFEPKIKSGMDVLEVKDIEKSFGDFQLLKEINFNIYRGEKVGLIGANGIGKTTLFKIILNQLDADNGEVNLGHNVFPGYFDQEMDKLNLDKTVIDEIWDENPKLDYYSIRTLLSQFLFFGDDILKEINDLSGGEKSRLSLLKLMLSEANLLLMDEPTNHLDIDSKEILEDAIIDYEGTLFVISHDRYFLNAVTNRILELTEDGIKEYLGNYDYYIEKKNELHIVEEEVGGKTKTQVNLEKKQERELLLKEKAQRQEILQLEKDISSTEENLEAIDLLLCDPELYSNPEKIVDLTQKRENLQEHLDSLYNKWIMLTD